MRELLACLGAAALAIAAGCGGNVLVDDAGSSNAGVGGEGGSVSPTGGQGGTVSPTGGSQPGSPNAVILEQGLVELIFSDQPLSCDDPDGISPGCNWWQVSVTLPDSNLLTPGLIDLEAAGATMFVQESGNQNGPDPSDCPGAVSVGGNSLPATLLIQSLGDDQAVVELQGIDVFLIDGQADGVYTAQRCK